MKINSVIADPGGCFHRRSCHGDLRMKPEGIAVCCFYPAERVFLKNSKRAGSRQVHVLLRQSETVSFE
jgi:hypothetical protein